MNTDQTDSSSSPRVSTVEEGPSFTATFKEHLDDSDPLSSDHPSASAPLPRSNTNRQRMRKSIDMVNALAFWKTASTPKRDDLEDHHAPEQPPPAPISSSARTVYILLTGKIPSNSAPLAPPQKLEKKSRHVRGKPVVVKGDTDGETELALAAEEIADSRLSGAEVRMLNAQGYLEDVHHHTKDVKKRNKIVESRPVPNIPEKAFKKAKRQLVDPIKARKIVIDLKRMEMPESTSVAITNVETSPSTDTPIPPSSSALPDISHPTHTHTTKAFALPPLSSPSQSPDRNGTANATSSNLPFTLISVTSPGSLGASLGALGAQKAGAIDLLGDVSGALIKRSHTQDGLKAPLDRIGVFLWYWGFELTIPPAEMTSLSSLHSIQSTFFALLYAMIIAGGAPELLPYVRYISSYLDMEWGAIKSQNRGMGVVVAATWLLPVALVPRPWDFAVAPPTPPASPSFSSFSDNPPKAVVISPSTPAKDKTDVEPSTPANGQIEVKDGEAGTVEQVQKELELPEISA